MRALRRALWGLVFVGLLVAGWRFAALHPDPVQLHYVVGERQVALWAALVGAFAAGGAVVGGFAAVQIARLSMLARRYRKAAGRLEAQVHELRNLPLAHELPGEGEPAGGEPVAHAPPRGG